jgi:ribosomal protein S27E
MMAYKLKVDKFRRSRGGSAMVLYISCAICQSEILVYQKDGHGELKRCYLNRILDPPDLAGLQNNSSIMEAHNLNALECKKCGTVVGIPMLHWEGRLAFRLIPGTFAKKRNPPNQS